jgi:hypothetical protein
VAPAASSISAAWVFMSARIASALSLSETFMARFIGDPLIPAPNVRTKAAALALKVHNF